jgi:hypothetical protein
VKQDVAAERYVAWILLWYLALSLSILRWPCLSIRFIHLYNLLQDFNTICLNGCSLEYLSYCSILQASKWSVLFFFDCPLILVRFVVLVLSCSSTIRPSRCDAMFIQCTDQATPSRETSAPTGIRWDLRSYQSRRCQAYKLSEDISSSAAVQVDIFCSMSPFSCPSGCF